MKRAVRLSAIIFLILAASCTLIDDNSNIQEAYSTTFVDLGDGLTYAVFAAKSKNIGLFRVDALTTLTTIYMDPVPQSSRTFTSHAQKGLELFVFESKVASASPDPLVHRISVGLGGSTWLATLVLDSPAFSSSTMVANHVEPPSQTDIL